MEEKETIYNPAVGNTGALLSAIYMGWWFFIGGTVMKMSFIKITMFEYMMSDTMAFPSSMLGAILTGIMCMVAAAALGKLIGSILAVTMNLKETK